MLTLNHPSGKTEVISDRLPARVPVQKNILIEGIGFVAGNAMKPLTQDEFEVWKSMQPGKASNSVFDSLFGALIDSPPIPVSKSVVDDTESENSIFDNIFPQVVK